jgi:eukaryotic-like serine/threonine-protein kinase
MAVCPDENTLADFISGGLSPERAASIEQHIDCCRTCADVMVGVARAIPERSGSAPVSLPLRAGDKVGRYRLGELLGRGGMGIVHRAHDTLLDREVALKILTASGELGQGIGEARALARLAHPNVVAVHDVGQDNGRAYIAMELVRGQSLAEWMSVRHTWEQVVHVFLQAAKGLAAAHAAEVLHRDFKPENVLVDASGRVAVTDFGLARLGRGEHELPRAMGTPAYMAPEQRVGQTPSAASDQWSFCLSFHEALFGARPGGVSTRTAPSWVSALVLRGLSDSPSQRHPSMQALIRELETGLERRASVQLKVNAWLQLLVWLIHVGVTALVVWAMFQPDDVTPSERADASSRVSYVISALFLALVAFGWGPIGIVWTPINAWGLFSGRRWAISSTLVYAFLSLPTCLGTPFALYALISLWSERRTAVRS